MGSMSVSSSSELGMPTVGDFEVISATFLEIAHEPDAVLHISEDRHVLRLDIERLAIDSLFLFMPLVKTRIAGLMKDYPGGAALYMECVERAEEANTRGNSLVHRYCLAMLGDEIISCSQSVKAYPVIDEPPQELEGQQAEEAADGSNKIRDMISLSSNIKRNR